MENALFYLKSITQVFNYAATVLISKNEDKRR